MDGKTTSIQHPNDPKDVKKFTFDYSYWSHDGFKDNPDGYSAPDSSHKNGKKFADQVCFTTISAADRSNRAQFSIFI